jgi:NAD(P)-dependent dehydrogenase (short-subunit alcohol dehydrogenase family)
VELQLRNKQALVTGSTAGIGFAIARRLAQEGARVIVGGREQVRVAAACEALRSEIPGAKVEGIAADLAREEGARRVLAAFPDVDVLVNNVGAYAAKPLEELETADWLESFAVNVLSGAWLSQHHLPRMLARDDGRVVFISSESALQIPVEMIHYGVAKAAQAALARGLAERTRGTRVTVSTVLAGPTRSEGVAAFVEGLAQRRGVPPAEVERDFFATARPTSLLQRFAEPDEIAAVVAFLASPLASAVNGAAVRAEGGVLKAVY